MKTYLLLIGLVLFPSFTWGAATMPAALNGKPRPCLDCHRHRNIHTNEGIRSANAFCYECHAQESCDRTRKGKRVSLQVTPKMFAPGRHAYTACIQCHSDVARSPHRSARGVECTACHEVHGEGEAHAPHLRVACEACHTDSPFVRLDPSGSRILLSRVDDKGNPISLADHRMVSKYDKRFCQRCHHAGNTVGAAAAVLPPKSFFCLACHNASLTMGPWMFWAALVIGGGGILLMISFWFRGRVGDEEESLHRKIALSSEALWETVFSRKCWTLVKTLLLDVFLQRRILKESVRRWSIHSLIFLAFLARFVLSVLTWILHTTAPASTAAMALVDKNHWFTAFANDFLGLCIVAGVAWAVVLRWIRRPPHVLTEEQDIVSLLLVGLLVLSGFALEGARILMTRIPAHVAIYSFGGYAVSRLWSLLPVNWQTAYSTLWYGHAALWALFLAYLPYGKLKHILTAPLSLLIRSQTEEAEQEG